MIRTPIDVAGIYSYKDNLQISHAVKAGNTIYISGQVALDPEGNVVGEGNAEVQAEYIWSNIEKVLGEAGSSLDEIVKIFVLVCNILYFHNIISYKRLTNVNTFYLYVLVY